MDGYESAFRENVYSVSEVNGFVKELIEGVPVFSGIKIRGEISNFTRNKSGHLYFSLKDEGSVIRAAMFIRDARGLRFEPADGMRVVAQGNLSVYSPSGSYQITVRNLEADGRGALYEAYERLKQKLSAEGLFDQVYKRPIPKFPRTVGVITSPTGAAVRDIINVCGRRYPLASIVVYPAVVQGEGAEASLVRGVRYFKEKGNADVVIIGRGGGSIEDLWAFNSEALAREIAGSGLPFISAVGHETDNTICDLVCSLRAPTPSGAAELAVPDIRAVADIFDNYLAVMKRDIARRINDGRQRLSSLSQRRVLTSPYGFIDEKRQRLDICVERLNTVVGKKLSRSRALYEALAGKLEALSPLSVLTRGYGAVYSDDGGVLTSVKGIEKGQTLKVRFNDGSVRCVAEEITEN